MVEEEAGSAGVISSMKFAKMPCRCGKERLAWRRTRRVGVVEGARIEPDSLIWLAGRERVASRAGACA